MSPYQIQMLHALARQHVQKFTDLGYRADKKLLRFNEIVATGIGYARLQNDPTKKMAVARAGVCEAVEACFPHSPLYVVGRGPLTLVEPYRDAIQ